MEKVKIFIGVPCTTHISEGCKNSINALVRLAGFIFSFRKIKGGNLCNARNKLFELFEESDCEFFLGIDSDIEFTIEDFLSLYNRNLPLVFGAFKYKIIDQDKYVCGNFTEGYNGHVKENISSDTKGVTQCDWSGMAFFLFTKNFLSRIEPPYIYQPFVSSPGGKQIVVTETIGFCLRLRCSGEEKVFVDCDVNLIHKDLEPVKAFGRSGQFNLSLNKKDALQVVEGLKELPFKTSSGLIKNIVYQMSSQIQLPPEGPKQPFEASQVPKTAI